MATIRQVSEKAGVSVATVSRVMNGNAKVSETTRVRVESAMDELGYQPNLLAQSLATSKSNIIGLVVADLAGPFFGDMMYSLESHLKENDKHLIITSAHGLLEDERDAVNFLLKRRCDALVLHVDAMPDDEVVRLIKTSKIPIILLNRFIPEVADRCIYLNNLEGGRLATKLLIEAGHKNIACITGPLQKNDAADRLKGFQEECAANKLNVDESIVIESNFTEPGGAEAIVKLLKQDKPFDAVFCGNDLMAIGAISELRAHGIAVPEQVSVIGYDDIVMSRYLVPGLTTIRVPVAQMGKQAGELALRLIEQDDRSVQFAFEPEVINRGTVRS